MHTCVIFIYTAAIDEVLFTKMCIYVYCESVVQLHLAISGNNFTLPRFQKIWFTLALAKILSLL